MIDKLAKEIAQEMNLDVDLVKAIIRDQNMFIKDTIENGDFRGIKLDYWGKFVVKPNRLAYLRHMTEQKKLKDLKSLYEKEMENFRGFNSNSIPDWILASTRLEEIKSNWDNLVKAIESLKERPTFEEKYGDYVKAFYDREQIFFRELNKKYDQD